jgi:hypothetical protein
MLIVDGREVAVPGRRVVNFRDDPSIQLETPEDGRRRPPGAWIRQIILHTTQGIPGGADKRDQLIIAGAGPSSWSKLNIADMWRRDDRYSGAHLVVDFDATIYCLCDLVRTMAFHATDANPMSIGIEIKQGRAQAELYMEQIEAVVDLVDAIASEVGIQKQIPGPYRGRPLRRLDEDGGKGRDMIGVFGHRDQTSRRGAGDPGDYVMARHAARGYEVFDFDAEEDLLTWAERQRSLGRGLTPDGIPGPATVKALKACGFGGGLWRRPPPGLAELLP